MKRYCPIGNTSFISGYSCVDYAEAHPHEVARMMGYEVVEETQLKDWTLGELSEYCKCHTSENGNCMNCDLQKGIGCCPFECAPADWDLSEKPRFTEQDVEDAKILARALLADGFERDKMGDVFSISKTASRTLLDSRMFPSIQPGQSATLDEIIGGAHD